MRRLNLLVAVLLAFTVVGTPAFAASSGSKDAAPQPVKGATAAPKQAAPVVPSPNNKAQLDALQRTLTQKQAELQTQQKIDSLQRQLAQKQSELQAQQQADQKARLATDKAKGSTTTPSNRSNSTSAHSVTPVVPAPKSAPITRDVYDPVAGYHVTERVAPAPSSLPSASSTSRTTPSASSRTPTSVVLPEPQKTASSMRASDALTSPDARAWVSSLTSDQRAIVNKYSGEQIQQIQQAGHFEQFKAHVEAASSTSTLASATTLGNQPNVIGNVNSSNATANSTSPLPVKGVPSTGGPLLVAASLVIPYGGEVQGIRLVNFARASEFGIRGFKELEPLTAGTGLARHHLIPQRFAPLFGTNVDEMLAIALTKSEHQIFTNAWQKAISYGQGTANATVEQVTNAARQIYSDYPEILQALKIKF